MLEGIRVFRTSSILVLITWAKLIPTNTYPNQQKQLKLSVMEVCSFVTFYLLYFTCVLLFRQFTY